MTTLARATFWLVLPQRAGRYLPPLPDTSETPFTVMLDQLYLRRLRVLGTIEGTSTLVLFGIAMPLKYFAGMPTAVTIVGSIHGLLFLALVFAFVTSVRRVPLPPKLAAIGVFCAVIPFGPFLLDPRLKRVQQGMSPVSST